LGGDAGARFGQKGGVEVGRLVAKANNNPIMHDIKNTARKNKHRITHEYMT
jgi:hypothetical protein